MEPQVKRDLVLAPNEYAYMQDVSKGQIKVHTGPTVINQTAQDRPVMYDPRTGRFQSCDRLEEAIKPSAIAPKGFYLVLKNPAKRTEPNQHPASGSTVIAPDLDIGRKINTPGPIMFSLYPGQAADMIRGHHLRSNQYLLVRVYDAEEAERHWEDARIELAKEAKKHVKPTTDVETEGTDSAPTTEIVATEAAPRDLAVGQLLVVRGTHIAFYIPPTGISVVPNADGHYVRDANTLERLEHCVLVSENGDKRFEQGPQVVFPKPTERFLYRKGKDGKPTNKFSAIELNPIQAIHLKVIAAYTDDNDRTYKIGEELFVKGDETAIYYPREEHSFIKYDGRTKHFATAIPTGEARYVLNRMTGEIRTIHGPKMLLPDPRTEVIVRRCLSDNQVARWYPGNVEALSYNQMLRDIMSNAPTTRSGVVSEGDFVRNYAKSAQKLGVASYLNASGEAAMDQSLVSAAQQLTADDGFSRASSYTQPRTITLQTKYEGVPAVEIWNGFAVMIVAKGDAGRRRVEVGPKNILLNYDESLEVLELSTGKPKTTDDLHKTVYLRVKNNKVSDIVEVETLDHVKVKVKLSYCVNFEGDSKKWFDVENYVKYLCDHGRSVLKNAIKRVRVEDFYDLPADYIRDALLGKRDEESGERDGMLFKENDMRVDDVEVLKTTISDPAVAELLNEQQHDVVRGNIMVAKAGRQLEITRQREAIERESNDEKHTTRTHGLRLQVAETEARLAATVATIAAEIEEQSKRREVEDGAQALLDTRHQSELKRGKDTSDQRIAVEKTEQEMQLARLTTETQSAVERMKAIQPGFVEALTALGDKETLVKVAEAWNYQHVIGGKSLPEGIGQIFSGTPIGKIVDRLANGNGVSKTPTKPAPTSPSRGA